MMMRTLDGMWLRINEINKLENAQTAVNAKDITKAVSSFVVIANAEQIPSICKAIGLLSIIGPNRAFFISLVSAIVLPYDFQDCFLR
jgi:hypothetical protein